MAHFLIAVLGPTAIGKTAMSIALAEVLETEIISTDSRQFYKEMQIGTAVPSPTELKKIPHHFIQEKSIETPYSVGDFEREGLQRIKQLFRTHDCLLLTGGSGLYVKSILTGLDHFPSVKPGLRDQLNKQLKTEGITPLQQRLKELDPVYSQTVDLGNARRIIRALEVCISSGKPYSSFLTAKKNRRSFTSLKIGLKAPREILYSRIEKRVDQMMTNGLLSEAKALYPHRNKRALNTIGYKELFSYLDGEYSLDFAVSEIKKNTRRFAKRQLTWFRKDKDITWFPYDCAPGEIEVFLRSKMKDNR